MAIANAMNSTEKKQRRNLSSMGSPKLERGRGLCRMCGRLTEIDAVQDLDRSGRGIVVTHWEKDGDRLSGRFCADHIYKSPYYHSALLALERYDDMRARLQRQCFHNTELKQLHPNPAVNWFENRLVKQLKISTSQDNDPRKRARFHAITAVSRLLPQTDPVLDSGIDMALDVLADRLKRHLGVTNQEEEPQPVWALLNRLCSSDRRSFDRILALALYSLGHSQEDIGEILGVQTRFVATQIRDIMPIIAPDPEEANLGMAADYLLRKARITETQMEIVYWRSHGKNQSEITERLHISRQAVWKVLQGIPTTLRFDLYS